MSMEVIISEEKKIGNFLRSLFADQWLNKKQFRHLKAFMIEMIESSYDGTVSDPGHCHQSSASRFFGESNWNDQAILAELQRFVIRWVQEFALTRKLPLYLLVDDTIATKTKPSSRALNPIQGTKWHRSHLENKTVFGQQFVVAVLKCGPLLVPFQMTCYDKKIVGNRRVKGEDHPVFESKIDIAGRIIDAFPASPVPVYVLADSWYSCEALIQKCLDKGFHYIGAMKTNRKIFPKKFLNGRFPKEGISIKKLVKHLKMEHLDLVTVGKVSYFTWSYQGRIKGNHHTKIVLSWPKSAVFNEKALRVFMSTDQRMSTKKLLGHYSSRWPIEIFIRDMKDKFGFDRSQLRRLRSVERLVLLEMIAYVYLVDQKKYQSLTLGQVRRKEEKRLKKHVVSTIIDFVGKGMSRDCIFKKLNLE